MHLLRNSTLRTAIHETALTASEIFLTIYVIYVILNVRQEVKFNIYEVYTECHKFYSGLRHLTQNTQWLVDLHHAYEFSGDLWVDPIHQKNESHATNRIRLFYFVRLCNSQATCWFQPQYWKFSHRQITLRHKSRLGHMHVNSLWCDTKGDCHSFQFYKFSSGIIWVLQQLGC